MMDAMTAGNATIDLVPPDIMRVVWKSSMGETEADGMIAFARKLRERVPRSFLLVDVKGGGTIQASARKKISVMAKERYWEATVIVGASFSIRVAVELIINATKLLLPDATETAFVNDEPAALAWIAEQRKKLPPA